MPELPEVETVRGQLASAISGLSFVAVEQAEPFILRDCSEEELRRLLPGMLVDDVGRLGKFILIRLTGPVTRFLTLHLGMTGQVLVHGPEPGNAACLPSQAHPHTRFLFRLEAADRHRHLPGVSRRAQVRSGAPDAGNLALPAGGPRSRRLAGRLGRRIPCPATGGSAGAAQGLPARPASPCRHRQHLRRRDPVVGGAQPAAARRLARPAGGVAPGRRDPASAWRRGCAGWDAPCPTSWTRKASPATFQEHLRAYGRHGLPCSRCGAIMVRVVIAGRGTAYCPGCQR